MRTHSSPMPMLPCTRSRMPAVTASNSSRLSSMRVAGLKLTPEQRARFARRQNDLVLRAYAYIRLNRLSEVLRVLEAAAATGKKACAAFRQSIQCENAAITQPIEIGRNLAQRHADVPPRKHSRRGPNFFDDVKVTFVVQRRRRTSPAINSMCRYSLGLC